MAASRKKVSEQQEKTPDYTAIGEMLCDTRASYGLTLDQVAHALRVKPSVVSALEKGTLEAIPGGMVYAKGHLRTYAQYLGVNLATMLNLLVIEAEVRPVASLSSAHSEPRRTRMAAYISMFAIVVLVVGWLLMKDDKPQAVVSLVKPVPEDFTGYMEDSSAPGLSSPCISNAAAPAWPPCFRQEEATLLKRFFGTKYQTVMQVKE